MSKLLYIGNIPEGSILAGGDALNARNIAIIEQIKGKENVDFITPEGTKTLREKLRNYLLFNTPLYSGSDTERIAQQASAGKYSAVFLDASLYGKIVRKIKKLHPEIKILAHYHNIETFFIKSQMKLPVTKIFHHASLLPAVWYNEYLTAKYADVNIVLNRREEKLLWKYYRKKNPVIMPISYEDRFNALKSKDISIEKNILFVGSDSFPNVEGIKWFVWQVMPRLDVPLYVVGKGMEKHRRALAAQNVHIVGSVEDVSPYYYNASCVVAPIFAGGGMKTKTAEALMYGKTIFATTESLQGYDINEKAGKCCNTAGDFIDAIRRRLDSHAPKLNTWARQLFLEKYSTASTVNIFKQLLFNT
jgi:hypothetical protein